MPSFELIRDRASRVSFTDPSKFTRAQKFIEQNKKKLEDSSVFFNPDTTFIPVEDFHEANLRVLIVFGSPASVKAVSSTAAALNSFVREICNQPRTKEQNTIPQVPYAKQVPEGYSRESLKVFMDFTYVPNGSDMKLFDKNNMPYAIGNITHLDASYFDVVGFSISVLSEVITCPNIIKSFSRCDSTVPLTWTERKGEVLGRYPLIYAGGITAACSDIMFGELGDGRQAFVDYLYLGSCEKMDIMWERHIEALVHNDGIRARAVKDGELIPPMPPIYNHNGVDIQGPISNQDYINSLFDMPMVYQPQAYKVVFDDRNRVIENTKINQYAQDFVKPYYPLEIDEDCLGIGMTVIQANGDNVGTSQIQVSEGAMLKGTLIRTSQGFKRVEEIAPKEIGDNHIFDGPFVDTTGTTGVVSHAFNHGVRKLRLFTLKSGIQIGLTDEHPVEQWRIGESKTSFKEAGKLTVGDFFIQKLGSSVHGNHNMSSAEAEFLGRMVGDGSYNLYDDSRGNRKPHHKMYLACDWTEAEYCEELLERANIAYTKDENQERHCRFWILAIDKLGRRMDGDFWGFNQRYGEWKNHSQGKKYIPSPVYKFDYHQMRAFLKGFHDADGCTLTKDGLSQVTFDSCHEHIINDLQQFLLFVGIPTNKHYYQKHRVADDELGFKDTVNDHWSLTVSSEYFNKFNDLGVLKKASCRSTMTKEKIPFDIETIRDIIYSCNITTEQRSMAFAAVRRNSITKELAKKIGIDYLDFYYDEIVSIEEVEGEVFDLTVPVQEKLIANGCSIHNCSAAGSCSFCAEGNYTGGWVEKTRDRILWEARESKKYSAGYKMKPFSFNCNYVTDYKGMLWEFMKIYPKVTFINMRMEELGRDVDALKMMKLVGSNRISAPMEGISPRIQNNLLNKCLSEESLTNFMDDMVHARLTDIKVGGIFTGYEEDEDFQWICDFVDRYKQRAAMENGNFPFRLKVTPLVHYNLTPIEYIERKSAKKSFEGEHWLTDEWYEKFREHNVFFKVNGFRYSTFIEQSIIDLGRSATKWMYDNIVSQNLPVYSLRSFATEEIVNNLKKIVNKDWFFEARNPEHYISISHRIHIDLMGSYIPRARRLVRLYEQGKILENPMDIRCLKTFEGAQTKCYSACVAKDPLKVYKDVKLDENDNLVGEYRELKGCERCPDKKHKMDRLARPTPQTKHSEDIIALPKLKPVQKVRFVLKRTNEYCVLNPNNTAHTFVAKFLQESEELVDMYYGVGGHNFFWQSDADIPYEVSGFQVVDVLFTSTKAYSIIDSLADKVSKSLKSVKIISYKKEFVEDQIKVNDYNVYRFETTLPYDLFQSACVSYKGDIRVKKDVLLETITDKSLKKPAFISLGKTVGYFVLPCKYNPYLYIQGLLMEKRIPLTKLRQEMNIENVLIVRDSMNICSCGKEKGFVSMVTGKQMKFGLNCLPAALLKVELNRKK